MASVFRPTDSETWVASYRAWNAAKGKFVWRQKGTGVKDRAIAAGIAATLERGSLAAKAGLMNRDRANELVNDILRLAGLEELEPIPSFRAFLDMFLKAKRVSEGTMRKYSKAHDDLLEFLGTKADLNIGSITGKDMQAFYDSMRTKKSTRTANDLMVITSMLFGKAIAKGIIDTNPCASVTKEESDSVDKEHIERSEHGAIVRKMLKHKRRDWIILASLGWHSGHRIQDLLDLTKAAVNLKESTVTIQPRKKGRRGGRTVVLPLPRWLARALHRLGDFKTIFHADNRNGKASTEFIEFMKLAGVDPKPVQQKARKVHLKSFHSYRHSMTTRLTAAGVTGEISRLVTDHDDVKIQQSYTHREIESLRDALEKARKRR